MYLLDMGPFMAGEEVHLQLCLPLQLRLSHTGIVIESICV